MNSRSVACQHRHWYSLLTFATIVLAVAIARGAEPSDQTTHLRVVGGLANVTQFTKFERPFWQTEVPKLTQGRITADIYPFDQSGFAGPEMLQLMRLGVVSFGTALLAQVAADEPELNVVDLPTLNPDMKTLRKTVSAYRSHIADILARRYGVELLAIYAYPAQVLFCTSKFQTLHDLAGRKVRTSSVGQSEMMEALGAVPIQIPFAKIVDSFRRGVVDCAITGTRSGAEIGLPEVTSYISPLAISWGLSFFGANRDAWHQLPADVRKELRAGIQHLEAAIWDAADRETSVGLACDIGSAECDSEKTYHMTLVPVDPADQSDRRQFLIKTILPQWIQRCGQDCVDAWNSTLARQFDIQLPSVQADDH
ncbi:MAG TPA: TRAP transporter substrate-binding protein [Rhodopila sp.]|uniref:TRAP transporter substrate-binding protein n=1 Tax=Rhodopila sp. TaxID=2480087 RepID=UPI002C4885BA|nr:TRAP transporter substrate-binding protein [Rhodopila sp.]HVY13844.1 TRAP transporter substrate-binding protein [Rhodopila sp.]